ncbi:saccharopine dehydrogenase family protein [Pseudomonas savastanoi]|uniref:saccharopine dehydrogenase family protein n=1 Tax=Pseudomonas savastanoi TaxID=29438 RepID=UPI001E41E89B|nr:saccharopine dehydrogenase NADP-binding domain-containing protein [Pseudomonas savastanoi]UFI46598.1 saccharopine dehydrogenase NADP-binding domain-containing protein [Pseudomonas savastanoi]
MALRVLVIGGYGNFGSLICNHLVMMPDIELVISGRDSRKLAEKVAELQTPGGKSCESWCVDIMQDGAGSQLRALGIDLLIHTAGPFQGQSYAVARHCIAAGVNYCDLSDCRTFVSGIATLDALAREAGVCVLSGCSSVPTLSAAIIDQHRQRFLRIDSIEHGISSAAKMPGLSTVRGVLANAGRPIRQLRNGKVHEVHGWMDLTLRRMPGMGTRLVANVDVPDLDVFATRYAAQHLSFKAGSALKAGGIATWLLALAIRCGLLRDPASWAERLYRWGARFEHWGDRKSAMYIDVDGVDLTGQPLHMRAQLTALNDKGPEIPGCAAVALSAKMAGGYRPQPGARACVGEITVDEYLAAINEPENIRLDVHFTDRNV